ncbi:ankyrin repeat domain-containing protein [Candidatus Dependentiae bacterium]|nr:ankyrin repeat domain-containing protein [Candidatus Dependentiae bacterium]
MKLKLLILSGVSFMYCMAMEQRELPRSKSELNKEFQDIYRTSFDSYREQFAKKLLNAGADINSLNNMGYTPLMLAVMNGNVNFVKFLLKNGANVNFNTGRNSALTLAIRIPSIIEKELVQLLVDNGADLNVKIQGETPLELAKRLGRNQIAHVIENR